MEWELVLELAAFPAIIGVLIYILGHLLATLLNKPDIKKYVEAEMFNVLFILLALMVIPAMNILSTQYTQYINQPAYDELCAPNPDIVENGRCHVVVAGFHLEMMSRELIEYYSNVFLVQTLLNLVKGIGKTDVVQGGKGVDVTLFTPFVQPIDFFFNQISDIMSLLTIIELAQLNLVWIITDQLFFQSILILGIILRFFPPTKLFGGLLMAVAIALYYIYPLAVVTVDAHYRMAYDYEPGMGRINRLDFIARVSEITAGWIIGSDTVRETSSYFLKKGQEASMNEAESFFEGWMRNPLSLENVEKFLGLLDRLKRDVLLLLSLAIQVAFIYITLFFNSVFRIYFIAASGVIGPIEGAYTDSPSDLIPTMFNMVSEFMLVIAVLTYLSLISTIAFIKSFSPLLGGDVEIAGVTKLI